MSLPAMHMPALVPVACGLVALGIACYQLSLPHVLLGVHGPSGIGYDDGVYLGSAIRLLHGVLPYRDFDLLHPPGITLLMAPVGALERIVGARHDLAIARCLTAVVVGLNAALAAMVVRRRGPSAMLVAGIVLSCFPLAVTADHSLMLEPYLVCFCLLGALALFGRGELSGRRKVFLGGLAFGFAGAIEVWAILPVLAALVCCLPRWKRGVRPLAAGLVVGFGAPSLPFLALAPRSFLHDVVVSHLNWGTSGVHGLSVADRLVMITGLWGLPSVHASTTQAVAVSLGIVALAALVYAPGVRRRQRLEWFILASVAAAVAGMLLSPGFFDHYAYFPAAFIALLLGVCARGIIDGGRWIAARIRTRGLRALAVGASWIPVAAVVAAGVVAIPQDATYARDYLSASDDPGAVVAAHIPIGACVVFDEPVLAINADRFNPAGPGCPADVDPLGMWIARDNGRVPPTTRPIPAAFVNEWRSWLERADYVVLSVPQSDSVPWTPGLATWFDKNYLLMSSQPQAYVYNHLTRVSSGTAKALLREGVAAAARGNLALARTDFGAILSVDPANTDAYFDLGVVDQKGGLSGLAATEYQQATFLDPRFAPALVNLAILTTSTAPSKAIALYRRALAIKPADPDTEFNLGLLLVRTGRSAEGLTMLENAVHTDPSLRAKLPAGITVP